MRPVDEECTYASRGAVAAVELGRITRRVDESGPMEKPWLPHYEAAVPATIDYPPISLCNMLEDTVRRYPNKPAFNLVLSYLGPLTIGARLTYRQFDAEVDRLASGLAALGVRKGDRIAIMLPNLPVGDRVLRRNEARGDRC